MKTGDVLDGRFELVQCIGGGGMGSVWEAQQLSTNRRVALKALHEHLTDEEDLVARFLREAKAALESRYSGHIIEVLDVVHSLERAPYLVMEYLEGEDLAQILEREELLEPVRAAQLIIQACHAVAEVHRQNIIHRDVKPENLFVTRLADGTEWIKLLDFGVAKFSANPDSDERPLTAVGSTLGTPFYMAPEQVLVSQTLDHRLDVYSMGVVLYEVLTGQRPYESGDIRELMIMIARGDAPLPSEVRPEISEELERVVCRAMALSKDDRYDSMFDLAEALEPFANPGGPDTKRARHIESFKTVIQKAQPEIATESQLLALEPPTSPSLPVFDGDDEEDEGREEDVSPTAETAVAVPQIASAETDFPEDDFSEDDILGLDAPKTVVIEADTGETSFVDPSFADVEAPDVGRLSAWGEFISSWRERSPFLLVIGLGLGLAASALSFALVVVAFQDEEPDGTLVGRSPGDDGTSPATTGPPQKGGDWWTQSSLVKSPTTEDVPPDAAVVAEAGSGDGGLDGGEATGDEGDGGGSSDSGMQWSDDAGFDSGASLGDADVVALPTWVIEEGQPATKRRPVRLGKTLSRAEVRRGLQSLQRSVQRCLRRSKLPGRQIRIRYRIYGDGAISYVSSTPRTSPQITACLRHATRAKRFRRTGAPSFNAEFPYPLPSHASHRRR